MTRTKRLRLMQGWSQPRMAEYLGQSQANVSRLESGQAESGPVAQLLDLLERQTQPPEGGAQGVGEAEGDEADGFSAGHGGGSLPAAGEPAGCLPGQSAAPRAAETRESPARFPVDTGDVVSPACGDAPCDAGSCEGGGF